MKGGILKKDNSEKENSGNDDSGKVTPEKRQFWIGKSEKETGKEQSEKGQTWEGKI